VVSYGVSIGICLGNSRGNFQLHSCFTPSEKSKKVIGTTFLTHTVCVGRSGNSRYSEVQNAPLKNGQEMSSITQPVKRTRTKCISRLNLKPWLKHLAYIFHNFTVWVKICEIWPRFSTAVRINAFCFRNEATYLKYDSGLGVALIDISSAQIW